MNTLKEMAFSALSSPLLNLRIENKRRKKTNPDYKGIDPILMWMLVTYFGYTDYRNAKFGQIQIHERIMDTSRELLLQIMEQAEVIHDGKSDLGKAERITSFKSLAGQKTLRILVAEDNPSNQKVLIEMLRRLGCRADAVADGRETVQALELQDYDLILIDIKMPEMDGISATRLYASSGPIKAQR